MKVRSSIAVRVFVAAAMAASIVGVSALGALAAPAGPSAQSTSCHLKAVLKFNPGLTFTEQQQKIRAMGKLTHCSGGGVTSATFRGKGGGSLSCTSGTGSATVTITWNTLETSVVSLTLDVGNDTFSGTVVSGKFAGEDVTASDVTITPLEGDCVFTPVTKARVTASVAL
jgi:hypothetical protein